MKNLILKGFIAILDRIENTMVRNV